MASSNCIICNTTAAKSCLSCHSASYCSKECQKQDWPLHRRLCKVIPTMFAKRPSPSSRLAILFPVESKVPELVWVNCPIKRLPDDDNEFEVADVLPFLGPRTYIERMLCWNNQVRKIERLDHTIVAHIRDNALSDGSKPNQAIIAASAGKIKHRWSGPVVVLSQVGEPNEPYSVYQDITLGDVRHIVDYFVWIGSESANAQQEQHIKDMGNMGFTTMNL